MGPQNLVNIVSGMPPANLADPCASLSQASFPKEDISYAALSLDALDQDTTYANTGDIVTHLPGRGHEELTEYSTVVKP